MNTNDPFNEPLRRLFPQQNRHSWPPPPAVPRAGLPLFMPLSQITRRVFISFASEDLDHVRGLRLLNTNKRIEIDFYDESLKVPVNSVNALYIRNRLKDRIKRASVTLCLASTNTYRSSWVDWELRTSSEAGNRIIAMATKDTTTLVSPKFIKDNNIKIWKWDVSHLIKLIG